MAAEKEDTAVGSKRAREEDAIAEEVDAKKPATEDAKVDGAKDETVKSDDEPKDSDADKKEEKPSTSSLFGGGASAGFGGFGGFGASKPGEGGGGFGGFGGGGGGFGGFAKSASTEGGFPSLSKVFGDSDKPVQLFGAKPAAATTDENGDDVTPESAPAETKPVISLKEEEVTTGEEDEDCIFTTEGALYEFTTEEGKAPSWKERGRGELRVNLTKTGGARMIMRAKGNYRLILNAAMWKGQTFTKQEGGKGLSFPCKNAVAGEVRR
jgi:Ran-binding protein 3|tara:strand:- start:546 stop:1346 length:801 start_codon:yes stop_codon:yes gene_type:complete